MCEALPVSWWMSTTAERLELDLGLSLTLERLLVGIHWWCSSTWDLLLLWRYHDNLVTVWKCRKAFLCALRAMWAVSFPLEEIWQLIAAFPVLGNEHWCHVWGRKSMCVDESMIGAPSETIPRTSWPGQLCGMVLHTDLLDQKQAEDANLSLTVCSSLLAHCFLQN